MQASSSDENEFFALVVNLIASARLSLDEPAISASFRLLDTAARLIDAADRLGLGHDEQLVECRAEIEREKLRVVDDPDYYRTWLSDLLARLTLESRQRNRATASDGGAKPNVDIRFEIPHPEE